MCSSFTLVTNMPLDFLKPDAVLGTSELKPVLALEVFVGGVQTVNTQLQSSEIGQMH